jgi:hypothetical protein
MKIEIDLSLLKIEEISISQLVFLSLVLNNIKITNQNVRNNLLSRVSEEEKQDLVKKNLMSINKTDTEIVYKVSDHLLSLLKPKYDFFDQFYEQFPTYVIRPDGSKGYLRTNVNKCRHLYNQIVGKSEDEHNHIMDCLTFEIRNKTNIGKLGYMKSMWHWLTNSEWENSEEQMKDAESVTEKKQYGTDLI